MARSYEITEGYDCSFVATCVCHMTNSTNKNATIVDGPKGCRRTRPDSARLRAPAGLADDGRQRAAGEEKESGDIRSRVGADFTPSGTHTANKRARPLRTRSYARRTHARTNERTHVFSQRRARALPPRARPYVCSMRRVTRRRDATRGPAAKSFYRSELLPRYLRSATPGVPKNNQETRSKFYEARLRPHISSTRFSPALPLSPFLFLSLSLSLALVIRTSISCDA